MLTILDKRKEIRYQHVPLKPDIWDSSVDKSHKHTDKFDHRAIHDGSLLS